MMSTVVRRFGDVWFSETSEKFWFAARSKRASEFVGNLCDEFLSWVGRVDISDLSLREKVVYAVMVDQMPRNARAIGKCSQEDVDEFDKLAMEIFLQLKDERMTELCVAEACFFSLIPRHTKIPEFIEMSGNFLRDNDLLNLPLAQKFAAETAGALTRARSLQWLYSTLTDDYPEISSISPCMHFISEHVDAACRARAEAFLASGTAARPESTDSLRKSIESGLAEFRASRGLSASDEISVLLSLSGGVDSVAHLACLSEISGIRLACLVISYPRTVDTELPWIFLIGKKLGIPIYHRAVKLERPRDRDAGISRDEFELWTKAVRFDAYRKTLEIFSPNSIPGVVVLGHHADDRDENILEQISRGHAIGDLAGIGKLVDYALESEIFSEISAEYREKFPVPPPVTILRPAIDRRKRDMTECAEMAGVWWMRDSTPLWSVRGQTRLMIDHLEAKKFPIKEKLEKISMQSAQTEEVFETVVKEWREQRVISRTHGNCKVWWLPMKEVLKLPVGNLFSQIVEIGNIWNSVLSESVFDVSALSRVPVENFRNPEAAIFEKILFSVDFGHALTLKAIRHVFSQRPGKGDRSGGFTEDLGFMWVDDGATLIVYESPKKLEYVEGFKQQIASLFK